MEGGFYSLRKVTATAEDHAVVDATPLDPATDPNATNRSGLNIKSHNPPASPRPTEPEVINKTTYHRAPEAETLFTVSYRLSECKRGTCQIRLMRQ